MKLYNYLNYHQVVHIYFKTKPKKNKRSEKDDDNNKIENFENEKVKCQELSGYIQRIQNYFVFLFELKEFFQSTKFHSISYFLILASKKKTYI